MLPSPWNISHTSRCTSRIRRRLLPLKLHDALWTRRSKRGVICGSLINSNANLTGQKYLYTHTHTHKIPVQYNTNKATADRLSNMSKTIHGQIFVVTGDTNQMLIFCRDHRGFNLWTTARLTGRLVEKNQCRNYSKKQTSENKTEGRSERRETNLSGGRNVVGGDVWVRRAAERFMVEIWRRTFDPNQTQTHTLHSFPVL